MWLTVRKTLLSIAKELSISMGRNLQNGNTVTLGDDV